MTTRMLLVSALLAATLSGCFGGTTDWTCPEPVETVESAGDAVELRVGQAGQIQGVTIAVVCERQVDDDCPSAVPCTAGPVTWLRVRGTTDDRVETVDVAFEDSHRSRPLLDLTITLERAVFPGDGPPAYRLAVT